MKKMFIAAFAVAALFTACKKDQPATTPTAPTEPAPVTTDGTGAGTDTTTTETAPAADGTGGSTYGGTTPATP